MLNQHSNSASINQVPTQQLHQQNNQLINGMQAQQNNNDQRVIPVLYHPITQQNNNGQGVIPVLYQPILYQQNNNRQSPIYIHQPANLLNNPLRSVVLNQTELTNKVNQLVHLYNVGNLHMNQEIKELKITINKQQKKINKLEDEVYNLKNKLYKQQDHSFKLFKRFNHFEKEQNIKNEKMLSSINNVPNKFNNHWRKNE